MISNLAPHWYLQKYLYQKSIFEKDTVSTTWIYKLLASKNRFAPFEPQSVLQVGWGVKKIGAECILCCEIGVCDLLVRANGGRAQSVNRNSRPGKTRFWWIYSPPRVECPRFTCRPGLFSDKRRVPIFLPLKPYVKFLTQPIFDTAKILKPTCKYNGEYCTLFADPKLCTRVSELIN